MSMADVAMMPQQRKTGSRKRAALDIHQNFSVNDFSENLVACSQPGTSLLRRINQALMLFGNNGECPADAHDSASFWQSHVAVTV